MEVVLVEECHTHLGSLQLNHIPHESFLAICELHKGAPGGVREESVDERESIDGPWMGLVSSKHRLMGGFLHRLSAAYGMAQYVHALEINTYHNFHSQVMLLGPFGKVSSTFFFFFLFLRQSSGTGCTGRQMACLSVCLSWTDLDLGNGV